MACSAVMDLGGKEVNPFSAASFVWQPANYTQLLQTGMLLLAGCPDVCKRFSRTSRPQVFSPVDSRVIDRQGSSTQVPTSQCEQSSDHSQNPQQENHKTKEKANNTT